MFHSKNCMGLLVCYMVDLSEANRSGFISVAISGGSFVILTGLKGKCAGVPSIYILQPVMIVDDSLIACVNDSLKKCNVGPYIMR